MNILKTALGRLRIMGFLEGLSFLVLLGIAMPLKYIWQMPEAVKITGAVHGLLFVVYCILLIQVKIEHEWPLKKVGLAILASIVPFGPFIADKKLFQENEANHV
ncbi:DUF3817 domain-containing protein [uncultured Microscilla sp.]|uniref:DUF3817 domain-containing protein n=1 Tax=uncultured Microscilla sp. TaxID=432653 RepID=UPI00262A3F3E|nr:DUF3817 domain-containing protein [uncultured Microscilla sp.]